MFKQKVKYVDFNGNDREETLYFHLSSPELTRFEAQTGGVQMGEYIQGLVKDGNLKEMLDFMEEIILTSYGVKSADGRSFLKDEESRHRFEHSQAYAEFFEMLLTEEGLVKSFAEKIAEGSRLIKEKIDESTTPTLVE